MIYIDEKFKECAPQETVKKIHNILINLGIDLKEVWTNSGLNNCFSLNLSTTGGIPFSNGKGITKELARASAYGEFIERLQGGLFYYKFQSIQRDPIMNIQSFAPDAKYMTINELIENGEWMDYLIEKYKHPLLDRKAIAEQCKMYACADDGKILTLPFYSLFEDKYIYLPMGFVDQIYATNGCCAGNTRDEAWVHALSEIMERHATLKMLISGKAAPKIPDEVINQYPIVANILKQIRESGDFDIDIFDYSIGNGFPVVSTRIIDKQTQTYLVNVAADPVFEIALERTLTELFQGKNIKTFTSKHPGKILNKVSDFPITSNILNQLETGNGLHTADFFANELTCDGEATEFADNSNKTNKELLKYLLDLYKSLDKPILVRNFSYLGFPCYRFVIPGFSEAHFDRLSEPIPEYAIADIASNVFKSPTKASNEDLLWMLNYSNMIKNTISRYNYFSRISGIPLSGNLNSFLANVSRAYAAYKLKQYENCIKFLKGVISSPFIDKEAKAYFLCVNKYIELKSNDIKEEKIKLIIKKFFSSSTFEKLYSNLTSYSTPFDQYLLDCNILNCDRCKYKEYCRYNNIKELNITLGKQYTKFINGQNKAEFKL